MVFERVGVDALGWSEVGGEGGDVGVEGGLGVGGGGGGGGGGIVGF